MNIRRTVVATLGAAVMSVAALAAQDKGSTVVYRGCLNLGTTEGTFFMSKATEKSQKDKEKISLKVTPATDKVKLAPFVLKEVEITGTVEAAPSGGSAEGGEQLGTLKATKVTWKNDYCG